VSTTEAEEDKEGTPSPSLPPSRDPDAADKGVKAGNTAVDSASLFSEESIIIAEEVESPPLLSDKSTTREDEDWGGGGGGEEVSPPPPSPPRTAADEPRNCGPTGLSSSVLSCGFGESDDAGDTFRVSGASVADDTARVTGECRATPSFTAAPTPRTRTSRRRTLGVFVKKVSKFVKRRLG
jgi:hypothetical protein